MLRLKTLKDVRTRMFQYKILNNILVNNYWLKKWKINDLPCTFCNVAEEDLPHMFWDCQVARDLIKNYELWWKGITHTQCVLNKEIVSLGNIEGTYIENICLVVLKLSIYNSRVTKCKPVLNNFINSLRCRFKLDCEIAKKKGKEHIILEKWGAIANDMFV